MEAYIALRIRGEKLGQLTNVDAGITEKKAA